MDRAVTLVSTPSLVAPQRQAARRRRDSTLARAVLCAAGASLDVVAIMAIAVAAGLLQSHVRFFGGDVMPAFLYLGALVTVLVLGATFWRGEYALTTSLSQQGLFRRTGIVWVVAIGSAFAIAFTLHVGVEMHRATLLGFCTGGFIATYFTRLAFLKAAEPHAKPHGMATLRIFLIGYEDEIHAFTQRYESRLVGTHVIAATALRGREHLKEDLTLACASARLLLPDDVFVLVPWSESETIDACVDAFLQLPTAIHLGPEAANERFADVEIANVGPVPSLKIARRPLSPFEVVAKRVIDITLAGAGLLLLAPLLLTVALAIKLDSEGPVIFRQRRYGFNQHHFRIWKFRSMRTMEDSSELKQVVEGDTRVTRFGDFMRRHNIDELPQLINVLLGDMSLIGPRPHALAHDQAFGDTISRYARRHIVKPGITGWAQVNGLRGGFSEEGMRARVEHDLYYIDNWSLWLDIKILWLTLTSKKSYTNAF
jgi:Undecaprenyl-phosphate glucose phosphotransferase